jgi:DNA-binding Lrp family transcriptional regulator
MIRMDATDITLCKLLMLNSRVSYRELAEKLSLSVNAVHRRIQDLRSMGVIQGFKTRPSLLALNAITILIFGVSKASFPQDARAVLEADGRVYWLSLGSGNYVFVGAYLRNLVEMDAVVTLVKKELRMDEPTVGILAYASPAILPAIPHGQDRTLYPLDLRIINALSKDSRREITMVAEDLGVSAKTVRRRLSRMVDLGLIDLTIEFYPDKTNDIVTIFSLKVKETVDKNRVALMLMQKYSVNSFFGVTFSNIPDLVLFSSWTNSMKELLDIYTSLRAEGIFESVVPNILFTGYIFSTWADRYAEGAEKKK